MKIHFRKQFCFVSHGQKNEKKTLNTRYLCSITRTNIFNFLFKLILIGTGYVYLMLRDKCYFTQKV